MLELKEIEMTDEQKKQQRRSNLLALYAKAADLVDELKGMFPGQDIKIRIEKDEDSYWLDGDCYSIEEHYYLPDR